jgi:CRP-like cAMP-binding protein
MPRVELSADLYEQLCNVATPMTRKSGTVLFRAGEPGSGVFLVRDGQVRLSLGDNPLVYPSRELGRGAVIGLPATFSGEPYSLTAEVEQDCEVYFVPRDRLLDLVKRNPEIGVQIARVLSEEIFEMRHVNADAVFAPDWIAQ